jgi:hypothetical protein
MGAAEEPVHLAGASLGEHRHICAFFNNAAEEYRVLLRFIMEGLARGDKAYHIVDPDLAAEHHRQLCASSIDVAAVRTRGQLELHHWLEVYLQEGRFDCERMLRCIDEVIEHGQHKGYPRTRITGHAEPAGGEWPGVDEFLEYECRLNRLVPRSRDCVICVYDLSKTRGDLIMDVMRTHPMVILAGVLQVNPFSCHPINTCTSCENGA